ncbi:P-loop containing nucleoside triphosphate hydrolase protein [Tothia fuscella]|uniref:ATP-dependent RNA helicase ROK1 n=1 Tax=Tothia fuscella TaxID=1048955 RepID=A0A9P4NR86_9PEZI|nr:P-loop containing nucleoside triphosphate hydrolase protein [Tothia fuscella]
MDIYKLLSRSTKLAQNSRTTPAQQSLPSSGQNANPQLFGHEEVKEMAGELVNGNLSENGNTVLGKRKRRGKGKIVDVVEELPPELDFFGERGGKKKGKKGGVGNGASETGGLGNGAVAGGEDGQEEEDERRLDEEECKAILRSHKLKVTVLSESNPPLPGNEKVKRKKKSKDNILPPLSSSKPKLQIYPQPLTSLTQLRTRYGISKRLAENIAYQGYKLPTEVQLAALPLLMGESGRSREQHKDIDLLAVAPTGSGKTLAFLIPVLDTLFKDKKMDQETEPQAIIVAPTRELANQIVNEGRKLVENTGIRISLVRKGMSVGKRDVDVLDLRGERDEDAESSSDDGEQSSAQKASKVQKPGYVVKSHVLVSTPLTLLHAIENLDGTTTSLPSVRFLVLDEADVLLDPLFRDQTLSIWNACSNPDLRTSLWSATMGSSIESLALEHILKNRKESTNTASIIRLVVGLKDTALPNITHILTYAATETGKLLALRQLLHPTAPKTDSSGRKSLRPPFLVFTQTIDRAKALHAELKYDIPPEAGGSSRIAALHSDMSETARSKVMTSFRRGEIWVIITTDLLARGIDFRGLNGVVNYDVPTSAAAYVHRVGRTGRAGREGGVAVTLYTKDDVPHVKPVANVIAASEKLRGVGGGDGEGQSSVKQWLLDALPTPSKRDKQELKRKGVESRRAGTKTARISTKSKLNRGLGAQKKQPGSQSKGVKSMDLKEEEFGGFSD